MSFPPLRFFLASWLPYSPLLGLLGVGCVLTSLTGCHRAEKPAPPPRVVAAPPSKPAPAPVPPPNVPESTLRLASYKASSKQFAAAAGAPPRVALTFDAGSDAKAVPLLLKTLKEHNVHATFFLTGKFCQRFPKECRAIADAGMEIGNHSFSHPHFTKLSDAEILDQLTRAEAAILKTCGRGARPLFRYPYGDNDKRTRELVAKAGYQAIYWTLDSLDSVGKPKPPDFVADRITGKIQGGYITLMHVSCLGSAQALPRIFAHLDKIGAKVVPVSDLLLTPPPPASHPKHIARR